MNSEFFLDDDISKGWYLRKTPWFLKLARRFLRDLHLKGIEKGFTIIRSFLKCMLRKSGQEPRVNKKKV